VCGCGCGCECGACGSVWIVCIWCRSGCVCFISRQIGGRLCVMHQRPIQSSHAHEMSHVTCIEMIHVAHIKIIQESCRTPKKESCGAYPMMTPIMCRIYNDSYHVAHIQISPVAPINKSRLSRSTFGRGRRRRSRGASELSYLQVSCLTCK